MMHIPCHDLSARRLVGMVRRVLIAVVVLFCCAGPTWAAVAGTVTSVVYAGAGSVGPFPVTFVFVSPGDLRVMTVSPTGVATVLAYPSAYSVSGGAAAGSAQPLTGAVTLTSALAVGWTVVIDRGNMLPTQPVTLPNAGPFQASVISGGFDRSTLLVQQVGAVAARALQVPIGDTAAVALPGASARAGGFLGFDASGNAVVTQTAPGVPPASWVSVKSFGASGDGVHDDTLAIQSAIAAVAVTGGVVYLPSGTYATSAPLIVADDNVVIQGAGGWLYQDGGSYTFAGTKIQRSGGGTGEMVEFITVNNPALARKVGQGMHDVWIDGGATAYDGVFVQAIQRGSFSDIHVSDCTDAAFYLTTYTSASHAEAMDLQSCEFTQCSWRLIDSAPVQSATGVVMTSAAPTTDTANVSYNEFHLCSGQTYDAPGIQVMNADNNFFQGCRTFVVGSGHPGLLLQGVSTACDYNVFQNCQFSSAGSGSGSGFIKIEGTGSGWAWSPRANVFFCMDDSNATVFPTMDANCDCQFHTSGGGWQRQRMYTGTATVGGLSLSTYLRVTTGAAAPTSRTWGTGDRCINSAPASGQPKGWICVSGGTPGTWVSEGNL